ncbi:MAG: hypothetical protein IKS32_00040 [Solobacterium sp.]|nr:hypothetical protein [Solobacterium sp.]
MRYDELSGRYPVFYYHDFAIIESEQEFHIQFDFEIEGLSHFNPDFIIEKPAGGVTYANLRSVREAAFSLGMVELISYWKLTCSPTVIVECGSLNADQVRWWKKLYFNGLGEFFYKNRIEADPETFMNLTSIGETITGHIDQRKFSGNLIPVGGGKDSFVTLQLLSGMKEHNRAFIINHVMSAVHAAQAAGYSGDRLIVVERTLDSRMLEFNKAGYLNGHTPFSALCAFAASLTAVIYGMQNICLSNEESANESTIRGSSVNHQYSKTFAFEQDFKYYMDTYITPEVHYFSVLRPLTELQIAGLFSELTQYHPVFRSCNVGQKEERWCGHCAKCLFVCIILSAYLSDEALVKIFGADMLNDESMRGLLEQLSGMSDNKPFECVGTREEVNTAIAMSIAAHEAQGKPLPRLYEFYKQSSYYDYYRNKSVDWTQYNTENLVPEHLQTLLKQWMAEMREK